jgi:outer membrane immunogenic protein
MVRNHVGAAFVAGAVFAFCAPAAFSNDAPARKPAGERPVAAYNWTGFYLGLHFGAASGLDADLSATTLTTAPTVTDPVSFSGRSSTGAVGGIHAGYNYQLNPSWVLGVEGDISGVSLSQSFVANRTSLGVPTPAGNFDTMGLSVNWLASARGRIGYAWDKILLYATGGGAWANIDYSAVRNFGAVPPNNTASFSATSSGWVAGGGVEYAGTKNLIVRAEYLYYGIASSQSALTVCAGGPASCGATPPVVAYSWGDSAYHVGRIAMSVKF